MMTGSKATTKRDDDEIYVAGIAMRGSKGPAQLALSTAYSLNFWPLYHFMVIINPPTSPPVIIIVTLSLSLYLFF